MLENFGKEYPDGSFIERLKQEPFVESLKQ
jgi:hypothetical protein